jgi:hypothetical protein
VDSRKSKLVRPAHQEAAKDAAVHVALLRLARERVAQGCTAHEHRIACCEARHVLHDLCLCLQARCPHVAL